MPRLLWIAPVCLCAYADSISVEISPDRHAIVREHYSVSGPIDFVFLVSPCARVEKIQSHGRSLNTHGSGPWITVSMQAIDAADLQYEVVPSVPQPRTCALPILMPKRPVDSVSVTVMDLGSGLSRIAVPQLVVNRDLKTWTASLPAVPSQIRLEWDTGSPPPEPSAGPAGRFAWNFWGLACVLVTWTVTYLLWAGRKAPTS